MRYSELLNIYIRFYKKTIHRYLYILPRSRIQDTDLSLNNKNQTFFHNIPELLQIRNIFSSHSHISIYSNQSGEIYSYNHTIQQEGLQS